jgi:hypothetical protein
MPRDPEDLWNSLLDEAADAEIDAAASVSVEQAERELAAAGFDVKAERARAEAFLDELEGKPTAKPVAAAPATAPGRRRRPSVLLLAAAATVTIGGGAFLYAELHTPEPPPHPLPTPPSPLPIPPVPTAPPVESNAPLYSASELRDRARAAMDQHQPLDCLRLLDQARLQDPAGDTAPEVQALRVRADKALSGKEP